MLSRVNNNHPSFGMAFRKPADMNEFTEFIGSRRGVVRGLKQFINEQKNVSNDIVYSDGRVFVLKGDGKKTTTYIDGDKKSRFAKKHEGLAKRIKQSNGIESIGLLLKGGMSYLKSLIFTPKDFLPDALRKAGEIAIKEDKNTKIAAANEVKAQAKKQDIENLFS